MRRGVRAGGSPSPQEPVRRGGRVTGCLPWGVAPGRVPAGPGCGGGCSRLSCRPGLGCSAGRRCRGVRAARRSEPLSFLLRLFATQGPRGASGSATTALIPGPPRGPVAVAPTVRLARVLAHACSRVTAPSELQPHGVRARPSGATPRGKWGNHMGLDKGEGFRRDSGTPNLAAGQGRKPYYRKNEKSRVYRK